MLTSILITFREALEAALLIGIVVSYLSRTNRAEYHRTVGLGLLAGLCASIIFGWGLFAFGGGLNGEAKEVVETGAAAVSVVLIGTFLFWIKHTQTSGAIARLVDTQLAARERTGLFLLITLCVLREGAETALFTFASSGSDRGGILWSILLGVGLAAAVGYGLFVFAIKIPIKKLFIATSIFLVFIAAGMASFVAKEVLADKNESVHTTTQPVAIPDNDDTLETIPLQLVGLRPDMGLVEWVVWAMFVCGGGVLLRWDNKKKSILG